MLKRLVIEFKDELDALGVTVDGLSKDMALFKRRLSGWQIGGRIRFDIEHRMRSESLATYNHGGVTPAVPHGESMGNAGMGDARINIGRFFGENDRAFFNLQIRGRNNTGGNIESAGREWTYHQFYAKIPFFADSFLTVGWVHDDAIDRRFFFAPDRHGRYEATGLFNYTRKPALKIEKGFDFGNFYFLASHNGVSGQRLSALHDNNTDAWELLANFNFNWNENFSFGIGGQYLSQDDWRLDASDTAPFNSVFTGWFGVDFKFMQGASLHGMIYFQSKSSDTIAAMDESANAWRVALNLGQDVLQFTSLWAEFGRIGQHFWAQEAHEGNMFVTGDYDAHGTNNIYGFGNLAADDITYWKIGAAQNWTDKVRTWLFYARASGDMVGNDGNVTQYGLGIDYAYNSYTTFGLNYMKWEGSDGGSIDGREYSRIRFTTEVRF